MSLNLLIIATVVYSQVNTRFSTSVASFAHIGAVDDAIRELQSHNHIQQDKPGVVHYEWQKLFDENKVGYR